MLSKFISVYTLGRCRTLDTGTLLYKAVGASTYAATGEANCLRVISGTTSKTKRVYLLQEN